MDLSFFSAWLDDLLQPKLFKDYCVNGLCVEANDKVTKVVTGVSFRDKLIDIAIENEADCIIVHHPNGFWHGENRVPVGHYGARIRKLMQHGISLYGFHLPLDGHLEIGNNAIIARALGLHIVDGFMQEGEKNVGCVGEWESPASIAEFVECVESAFPNGIQNKFLFGSEKVKRVAICSGSGASGLKEAISIGCDAYVTGDIKESVPIEVEESEFNLVSCGHHRTEIFGINALAEKIESELNIPSSFFDIDNPI